MVGVMTRALLILLAGAAAASIPAPDVTEILRRSVEANQADWKAASDYDYSERERKPSGSMTYRVWMIARFPIPGVGGGERRTAFCARSKSASGGVTKSDRKAELGVRKPSIGAYR